MSLPKEIRNLLNKHPGLVHTENCKVTSHVQREEDNWFVNTLMIADQNVPFLYKRKERYQSLTGARVNITYYPVEQEVAGIAFEAMKIVRLKRS